MRRTLEARARLLAGLGLGSTAMGSGCNTFDPSVNTARGGGGPVNTGVPVSSVNATSAAVQPPTNDPGGPVIGSSGATAPTGPAPSHASSIVAPLSASPSLGPGFQLREFTVGDGYRYTPLSSEEYAQLCGEGVPSSWFLLFCVDNPSPSAACSETLAAADVAALAGRTYSCGLFYSVRGGCGPMAWPGPVPAATGESPASGLDASSFDDGGVVSQGSLHVDASDARADAALGVAPDPGPTGVQPTPAPSANGAANPAPTAQDECCWAFNGGCAIGRPFRVGGTARLAEPTTRSGGWGTEVQVEQTELDEQERAHLAAAWLAEGFAEHASIASFSRFSLQCLALGAPAEIVRGAQQASLDEWQHAMTAFGLAQAYGAKPQQPGVFDIRGAFPDSVDIVEVAKSVVSEGCIAETVAAVLLAEARDAAHERRLAVTLGQMAEEEMQHAELAWRFLAWALGRDARVAPAIAELFEAAETHVGFGRVTQAGESLRLRAHGCLSAREQHAVARRALQDVVRPVANALLGRSEFVQGSESLLVARALNV